MNNNILVGSTDKEIEKKDKLVNILLGGNIYKDELIQNLGLFIPRQHMTRILAINELYKKILDKHGVIMEFGVRWGQNLALFTQFKGIYEPYNYNRKIIGFDTFEGFMNVDENNDKNLRDGQYAVTRNYENVLKDILNYHKDNNPISHISETLIIKGDASQKIIEYLNENPQTIISFVYFDFDIYKPTIDCLNAIKPHLTRGAVIAFDELNDSNFKGETIAFKEFFDINKTKLYRTSYDPVISYIYFNE